MLPRNLDPSRSKERSSRTSREETKIASSIYQSVDAYDISNLLNSIGSQRSRTSVNTASLLKTMDKFNRSSHTSPRRHKDRTRVEDSIDMNDSVSSRMSLNDLSFEPVNESFNVLIVEERNL